MRKRYTAALATLGLAVAGLAVPGLTGDAQAGQAGQADAATADQFIVTFADSAPAHQVNLHGVTKVRELATDSSVVRPAQRLDRAGANRLMSELSRQPGVVSVEPDLRMTALFTPNDPLYPQQWDLLEPAG